MTEEEKAFIAAESAVLSKTIESLKAQRTDLFRRLGDDAARAKDLTLSLVATRRDAERQLLASDEAVAHALRDSKRDELKTLDRLIAHPYFARIVIREAHEGAMREVEYKLGTAGNAESRIVDWRNAPLAGLYYEYREGDEFSEIIQERERTGVILKRINIAVQNGTLARASGSLGAFVLEDGRWTKRGAGGASTAITGQLPNILSLITPEQFAAITESSESAVLIQGVAGSGKTSVALHRLAWLLESDNSGLQAAECVVLVMTKALKTYISETLPSMDVHGVRVLTYRQWAADTLKHISASLGDQALPLKYPPKPPPPGVGRVMRSMAVLKCVEEQARRSSAQSYAEDLRAVLDRPDKIIAVDETGLLDRELIVRARDRCFSGFAEGWADWFTQALLLRLHQLKGDFLVRDDGTRGPYQHLVVDEVQEMSPVELAVVLSAVDKIHNVTLVGDTAQEASESAGFPGWEKLQHHWSLADSLSSFVSLTVSHRSTLPIMRLADHIHSKRKTGGGRPGRRPLWIRCTAENTGVEESLQWLIRVTEKYPDSPTAVICRSARQARHVHSLLEPTFHAAVTLGTEDSFSFREGIVITDVIEAKGLEFPNVLLWNPSRRAYNKDRRSRNLLYVAVTRARENLCLVTWGAPSPLLPSLDSKLVRGVERDEEEE